MSSEGARLYHEGAKYSAGTAAANSPDGINPAHPPTHPPPVRTAGSLASRAGARVLSGLPEQPGGERKARNGTWRIP